MSACQVSKHIEQFRVICVTSTEGENFDEKLAKTRFITVLNIICVEEKPI